MTLARMGLVALALAVPASVSAEYYLPAGDSVHERLFEVHPVIGWFKADDNAGYGDGAPTFGLRGSLNNSAWWALEAQFSLSPGQKHLVPRGMLESYEWQPVINAGGQTIGVVITDMQTTENIEEVDASLLAMSGTMLFHLSKKQLRPFLSLGGGFIDDIATDGDLPGSFSDLYFELGGGVKYYKQTGFGIRLDIRDLVNLKDDVPRDLPDAALLAAQHDIFTVGGEDGVIGQEPYSPVEYRGKRWLHSLGISLSVDIPFGWAWKDGDGDNIATRFDKCPSTAPSVVVDTVGCGIDTDGDGVFDGIDTCANTPKGATVDHLGCSSDTDGDGVPDGIDLANDTPKGAKVDAQGQHHDVDGDKVFDGLDQCDDTPAGAVVDARGCTADPTEDRLLRGKPAEVAARFESGSDELDPRSYRSINKFALIVERWTSSAQRPMKMEISVHAQKSGADAMKLAQQRADAVRTYMVDRFRGINANNLTATAVPAETDAKAPHVNVRVIGEGERPPAPPVPQESLAPPTPPAPETPGTPGETPK